VSRNPSAAGQPPLGHAPSARRSSLRMILLAAIAILTAFAVAACGADDGEDAATAGGGSAPAEPAAEGKRVDEAVLNPAQPVTLTMWSFQDQREEAKAFTKKYPNVRIRSLKLPSDNYYAKLQTAIKAGNAPDIALVEYQFMPTIQTTGGLADLTQYGANAVKADFPEWTWNQVARGEGVFGLPRDTGPMGMYYRKDVFDRFGIEVPTTWEEYAAAAEKLHEADSDYVITDFPPKQPGWFAGLAWQAGGRWFDIEGDSWKVQINDEPTKRVAAYWQDLIERDLVKTEPDFTDEWNADLQEGTIATWLSAVWGVGFLSSAAPKSSGDWRVAPMPQWEAGQQISGNWGGAALTVTKDSEHADIAAEYVKWLTTNREAIDITVEESALYPAASAGLQNATFSEGQEFFGGQDVYEIFGQASENVDTRFTWGPTMTQVYADIGDEFSKGSLTEGLDEVQRKTVADMEDQGISVTP
jgi:multiple sugar transport system substrate-binding protein